MNLARLLHQRNTGIKARCIAVCGIFPVSDLVKDWGVLRASFMGVSCGGGRADSADSSGVPRLQRWQLERPSGELAW